MNIKDIEQYVVFSLTDLNMTSEEVIYEYNKIYKRKAKIIHTGYESYYFIIPKSKIFYSDVRLKVYTDNKLLKYPIRGSSLAILKKDVLNINNIIKTVNIRYVDIEKLSMSKLKEVKDLLKTLNFNTTSYTCLYKCKNETLWYELLEDGLYLNNEMKFSTLNNDICSKADFNRILEINEVNYKSIYKYETDTK